MKSLLLVALLSVSAIILNAAEIIGTVNATTLNIRNRPDAVTSTVIAQLKSGDKVTILKESGTWYEIVAPANTRVYVSSEFLKDGKTTREVNLRAGASVNHQSYGIVPAGTELEAVEAPRGGWVRVKPLRSISCFVSTKYISTATGTQVTSPENDKSPAKPQAKPSDTTPSVSEEYLKTLNDLRALYVDGSAKSISTAGKLLELQSSTPTHPIRYMLETADKQFFWIVDIKPEAVKDYLGREVKISGVSYQVRNWKTPALEVTQISQ